MAKVLSKLTAREVLAAREGDHADGGGLFLHVRGDAASWLFRYIAANGKRREMGLGSCFRHSLAAAGEGLSKIRDTVASLRVEISRGADPVAERKAQRAEARQAKEVDQQQEARKTATLQRVARAYHEKVIEPSRSPKVAAQWIASLERNVPAHLWNRPVCEITAPQVLDVFHEMHQRIPETARRVRQRLERVFGDAQFRGLCDTNPAAAMRSQLDPQALKRERGEFRWLDYRKIPAFLIELRRQQGIAPRALEFTLLTAARTGEVLGATWGEFDLPAGTWTVPAARLKKSDNGDHLVYLAPRAIEILQQMKEIGSRYVFPSPMKAKDDKPLSNMAMLNVIGRGAAARETTTHGLCRKGFSSWANETGAARPDVIEACLAHREKDLIRRAYNKAQFLDERRRVMMDWARFLEGDAAPAVVPLRIAA